MAKRSEDQRVALLVDHLDEVVAPDRWGAGNVDPKRDPIVEALIDLVSGWPVAASHPRPLWNASIGFCRISDQISDACAGIARNGSVTGPRTLNT